MQVFRLKYEAHLSLLTYVHSFLSKNVQSNISYTYFWLRFSKAVMVLAEAVNYFPVLSFE